MIISTSLESFLSRCHLLLNWGSLPFLVESIRYKHLSASWTLQDQPDDRFRDPSLAEFVVMIFIDIDIPLCFREERDHVVHELVLPRLVSHYSLKNFVSFPQILRHGLADFRTLLFPFRRIFFVKKRGLNDGEKTPFLTFTKELKSVIVSTNVFARISSYSFLKIETNFLFLYFARFLSLESS